MEPHQGQQTGGNEKQTKTDKSHFLQKKLSTLDIKVQPNHTSSKGIKHTWHQGIEIHSKYCFQNAT